MKTLLSLLVLFTSNAQAQQQPPTYYPMICKGGAGITLEHGLAITPGAGSAHFGDGYVKIKYTKATVIAQPRGVNLAPGTCSWTDRLPAGNEPSLIYVPVTQYSSNGVSFQLTATSSSIKFSSILNGLTLSSVAMKFMVGLINGQWVTQPAVAIETYSNNL